MQDFPGEKLNFLQYLHIKPSVSRPELLKGPKREIFGLGIFAQIRPIWIGYQGTRSKNPKKLRLGPYIALYFPRFLC